MIFEILVGAIPEIVTGVIPAIPAYFGAKRFFLKKKPVVHKTAPSSLTPIIAQYHQRQLEIEGKIVPTVTQQPKAKEAPVTGRPETLMEQNYRKWSSNKAQIPLVLESVKILETLAAMSSLKLNTQELHNLEVLSAQTEELLTNFFNTPEAIRTMPVVERALHEQLAQIENSVSSIKVTGAETFVRNLQVGTEFIKTKFNSK